MPRGNDAVLFVGWHELSIDAKQRLAIPSEIRSLLKPERDGEALYAVIQDGPTLCLYTETGFAKRAEQLDASPRPADEVLEYEQMFFGLASRLEIDKQGRVRLPERLMRFAKVDREVVVLGVKDHLQVHDRAAWEAKVARNMTERPELLMNPRRVMSPKNVV